MSQERCPHCGQIILPKLSPEEQAQFDAKYLHPDTWRELKLAEQRTYRTPSYTYDYSDWRVVIVDGYGNSECFLTGNCREKAEGERKLAEMKQEEAVWLAKESETRAFQLLHDNNPRSELRRFGPRRCW